MLEDITINIKCFNRESVLLKAAKGEITLLKESELITEINQYVTTNISEFSHEQIVEISNPEIVSDLKQQVIIEIRGENSLLQNQQEIIAVLTNYQHNFEKIIRTCKSIKPIWLLNPIAFVCA